MAFQSGKDDLFWLRPDLERESDFDFSLTGGNLIILFSHFLVWGLVLIVIENGGCKICSKLQKSIEKAKLSKIEERTDIDDDVLREEERVERIDPDHIAVRVNKFSKVYKKFIQKSGTVAVQKASFGVNLGECFALLGTNGAGKSTCFKSLIGEVKPTKGNLTILGYDI